MVNMLAAVIFLLRLHFGAFPWSASAAILALCPCLGDPGIRASKASHAMKTTICWFHCPAKQANLGAKVAFWGSGWDGFVFYDRTLC